MVLSLPPILSGVHIVLFYFLNLLGRMKHFVYLIFYKCLPRSLFLLFVTRWFTSVSVRRFCLINEQKMSSLAEQNPHIL